MAKRLSEKELREEELFESARKRLLLRAVRVAPISEREQAVLSACKTARAKYLSGLTSQTTTMVGMMRYHCSRRKSKSRI